MPSDDDHWFLTIDETAALLRVPWAVVYRECREFLLTGGAAGLPCVRVGRTIRVCRRHLEDWSSVGRPR